MSARRAAIAVLAAGLAGLAACGGASKRAEGAEVAAPAPVTAIERMLAMLPQGAQLVVELDLARLRANPVIGEAVTRALAAGAGDAAAGAPLARVEAVVLAAYGVGTSAAATVTVISATGAIDGASRVAEGVYALGPEAWTAQVAQRGAMLEAEGLVRAQPELLELRARAMPAKAPGAALRVTARLPFDARVSLARVAGVEAAPAQLSIWGDVVDDLAIVIEADASDPGDRRGKQAVARLEAAVRGALRSLAEEPVAQALGLPRSLAGAKLSVRGTWVRAVIEIGPTHLQRVAQRASALLSTLTTTPPPSPPVTP